MSLSEDLLDHALELLRPKFPKDGYPEDVCLRRSISTCYYALFHKLCEDSVAVIAPHVDVKVQHRIQRWMDHTEMKRICGRFTKPELEQPLLGLIGPSASDDLQMVCSEFIQLQEERHSADYDPGYLVDADFVHERVVSTALAIEAWDRIRGTAEANIFILSLLMWKNWEKIRP